jgi:transcriptional regulator with XRE-family HTH domain
MTAAHAPADVREAVATPGPDPAQDNPPPVVSIRAERKKRCWTVPTMAKKLRAAMDDPKNAPDHETIRRNIRRWERSGSSISERYRLLYCQVFGRSESYLFGTEPPATETDGTPADTTIPEEASGNRYVVLVLPPGHHRITIDVTGTDEENEPETEPEPARRLTIIKDQHGKQHPEPPAIQPPGPPGAKRTCGGCGLPLSRYNTGKRCQACIRAGRKNQPPGREDQPAEPGTILVNGNAIAQARRTRGWTQAFFADRAGLSASLIQKLEVNVLKTTRPASLDAMARVLGIPVSAMLAEPGSENGSNLPPADSPLRQRESAARYG